MLLLNTVKYLKPIQVFWRIRLRLLRFKPIKLKPGKLTYTIPNLSQTSAREFNNNITIFNQNISADSISWRYSDKSKLWYYHLHYFDYLENCDSDTGLKIIENWIAENPYGNDSAWEPYPLSLRVVNWIKFFQSQSIQPNEKIVRSLNLQKDVLFKFRELHLLANHYFKNCVAILYLSSFFHDTKQFKSVIKEIKKQIYEQSLLGLHFEFSPTYHALFTKDLIDIYNLLISNGLEYELQKELSVVIQRALWWAFHLTNNGQFIPIGDVNNEGCPSTSELAEYYAQVHGSTDIIRNIDMKYFPIIEAQRSKLMLLNAPFNPIYNPAHSHCDKLSILFWYQNTPVIVDTGNYDYEHSRERGYARSVSAHNTIQVDDRAQAQMWDVFRIGKRGKFIESHNSEAEISASFRFKNAIHKRRIMKVETGYDLEDRLICHGLHQYRFYLHINPDLSFDISDHRLRFNDFGLSFILPKGAVKVIQTDFYPKMYSKRIKKTIEVSGDFKDRLLLQTKILI